MYQFQTECLKYKKKQKTTCVGSQEQTRCLVQHGAVPVLSAGLKENVSIETKVNTVVALGNIAGNGRQGRDAVLETGALQLLNVCLRPLSSKMHSIADNKNNLELAHWSSWFLCNIYRPDHPDPTYDTSFVNCLRVLLECPDEAVQSHLFWACRSFITTQEPAKIDSVISIGIVEFLVKHLLTKKKQGHHVAACKIMKCLCAISRTSLATNVERIAASELFSIISTFLQSENEKEKNGAILLAAHFSHYSSWRKALKRYNCLKKVVDNLSRMDVSLLHPALYSVASAIIFETVGDNYDYAFLQAATTFVQKESKKITEKAVLLYFGTILMILKRNTQYCKYLEHNGFLDFIESFKEKNKERISLVFHINQMLIFVNTEKLQSE